MEATVDPRHAHPRELIRGLMRGHRPELKQGYSATNAVNALISIQGALPSEKVAELQAYAEGFAAGMVEDPEKSYPGDSEPVSREPEEDPIDVAGKVEGMLDEIGEMIKQKFAVDRRVRSKIQPHITGTIVGVDFTDAGMKPITIRQDDGGGLSYFHVDQLEAIEEDPRLTEQFHLAVTEELNRLGLKATYEHPGFVSIDRGDGTTVNTGQHGWDYGSIEEADGTPKGDVDEVSIDGDTPLAVAAAWYEKIEGVSPVEGITPAQIRSVAKSIENMNRGTISGVPVICLGVDLKLGGDDPSGEQFEEGIADGDLLAVFKYQSTVDPSTTPGREETCFARNGDMKWSQDYG